MLSFTAMAMITPPPSRSGTLTDDACLSHVDEHREGHWIKLPEALFSSIMSVQPEINPLHSASKALSDEWLSK